MMSPAPYHCEEHDFTTSDPRKAMLHIEGDLIDGVATLAVKVVKAQLGIPR